MIAHILEMVGAWIVGVISALGYKGVMFMMAIESACIPLPSEIIMPFSGALIVPSVASFYGRAPFSLWAVATWGALGCNLGSIVAYEIGYFGGRPLVERFGRYVFLSQRELGVADRFFERRGSLAVLIARLLPVIRTFIALPAGVARMSRLKFHVYTFIGSWPWCLMLAYIGMRLGQRWETDPRLKIWFHRLDGLILVLIVAAVGFFIWSHARHRTGPARAAEEAAD